MKKKHQNRRQHPQPEETPLELELVGDPLVGKDTRFDAAPFPIRSNGDGVWRQSEGAFSDDGMNVDDDGLPSYNHKRFVPQPRSVLLTELRARAQRLKNHLTFLERSVVELKKIDAPALLNETREELTTLDRNLASLKSRIDRLTREEVGSAATLPAPARQTLIEATSSYARPNDPHKIN